MADEWANGWGWAGRGGMWEVNGLGGRGEGKVVPLGTRAAGRREGVGESIEGKWKIREERADHDGMGVRSWRRRRQSVGKIEPLCECEGGWNMAHQSEGEGV